MAFGWHAWEIDSHDFAGISLVLVVACTEVQGRCSSFKVNKLH